MKLNNQNLSKLMKQAWLLVKVNGLSMSEALKKAWANMKLRAQMRMGVVKFTFMKLDGSLREAWGTLMVENHTFSSAKKERKENLGVSTYYDTEKQAWRCFKVANLIF